MVRLLRDGTPVILRTIRPQDRGRLQQALDALSAASRRARFFADLHRFSNDQLTYLTGVDQDKHVAWIGLDPGQRMRAIGVGRFIRLGHEPHVGELALTVVDSYQERGLGTALLGLLYHRARALDVRTLRVYTAPTGGRFAERLRRLGAVSQFQDGLLQLDLPVHADPIFLPRNHMGHRLRQLLREYDAAFGGLRGTGARNGRHVA
jgi:GNAT superfamily N-acetyltransferase